MPRNDSLTALAGVTDPQEKRKSIGHVFIDVFSDEARVDRRRAVPGPGHALSRCDRKRRRRRTGPAATIKTHHNVGGLPEELGFELIEPLRDLFKDEVRRLGLELGLARRPGLAAPVSRPGPGRSLPGRRHRRASRDAPPSRRRSSLRNCIRPVWYRQTAQAFAVLLPVQSVGVMGDGRTYETWSPYGP